MSVLSAEQIGEVLQAYFSGSSLVWGEELSARPQLLAQLTVYLDLLVRWNERTNLSAIREPREIVRRHFGESLFAAGFMRSEGTLLDLGSGAGFPGLPIQLWWPALEVTLAESQGKKAAFLREVCRALGVGCEVWGGRVEEMSGERRFDSVVMRAVDAPEVALRVGLTRMRSDLWLLGSEEPSELVGLGGRVIERAKVPGSNRSFLFQIVRG